MNLFTRREILKWSAFAAAAACLPRWTMALEEKPKKILFFTKSSGFQHSVIDRHGKDQPAYAEKILVELGKTKGFEITPSKDGSLFTPEKLAEFDAFVFYTTGDLTTAGTDKQPPMPADGKQALLDAISSGKGFIGLHCATDTFHSKGNEIDPYIKMIGGEFVRHGAQQISTAHIVDPKFPGLPDKDISFKEEWYAMKNFATDLHVILTQQTTGMAGDMYKRPPYPSTWARAHGKGKVFYTSMGHREDVWTNSIFTDLLMGGIAWATGNATAEIPANLDSAAPGANT
jgi:type 1 glutamine amidotransferase